MIKNNEILPSILPVKLTDDILEKRFKKKGFVTTKAEHGSFLHLEQDLETFNNA